VFDYLYTVPFDVLVILGDLCDAKDCHPGSLVNKVVDSMMRFAEMGKEIHLLRGNHDYSGDPDCPFFLFLRSCPNCYYHNTAQIWEIGNIRWSFFPHSRTPEHYWADMRRGKKDLGVDVTLCHQTFSGAFSESGKKLAGCDATALAGAGKIFSGDVHVPQAVGPVEYVGAPYPIDFGDAYEPSMVAVENGNGCSWSYLYPPSIRKLVLRINDPEEIEFAPAWREGDQVKVVLTLKRRDFGSWESHRRRIKLLCDRNHLTLCGLELQERTRQRIELSRGCSALPTSHEDQFKAYCEHAGIDESDARVGRKLLGA